MATQSTVFSLLLDTHPTLFLTHICTRTHTDGEGIGGARARGSEPWVSSGIWARARAAPPRPAPLMHMQHLSLAARPPDGHLWRRWKLHSAGAAETCGLARPQPAAAPGPCGPPASPRFGRDSASQGAALPHGPALPAAPGARDPRPAARPQPAGRTRPRSRA